MKKFILILALVLSLLLISCASTDGSTVTDDSADTSADSGSASSNDTDINAGANSDTGSTNGTSSDSTETDGGTSDSAVQGGSNDNGTQSKGGEVNNVNEFILKARVVGKNDTHLEIEVIESDYAFGTYWVIVPSSTPISNAQGEALSLNDLSAGTVVEITYNGQTMMSYPPQIVALSINVK